MAIGKSQMLPGIFGANSALIYKGNCAQLSAAAERNELRLRAMARNGYPGEPLGPRLPGISTVGYWDAVNVQSWRISTHCNQGVKIGFLLNGHLQIQVDKKNIELNAGDMFVMRPWQLHEVGRPTVDISKFAWVMLDTAAPRPHDKWVWPDWLGWTESSLDEFSSLIRSSETNVFLGNSDVDVAFKRIEKSLEKTSETFCETEMRIAISMALLGAKNVINRSNTQFDKRLGSSFQTVKVFLAQLPYNLEADWTLDNMARECDLSRTQFSEYVKSITNQTPIRHLKRLRIEAAATELRQNASSSITNIALKHGFSSSQYFATAMKGDLGLTPGEIRNQS